jgi:hypothetical protein
MYILILKTFEDIHEYLQARYNPVWLSIYPSRHRFSSFQVSNQDTSPKVIQGSLLEDNLLLTNDSFSMLKVFTDYGTKLTATDQIVNPSEVYVDLLITKYRRRRVISSSC